MFFTSNKKLFFNQVICNDAIKKTGLCVFKPVMFSQRLFSYSKYEIY